MMEEEIFWLENSQPQENHRKSIKSQIPISLANKLSSSNVWMEEVPSNLANVLLKVIIN